MTLRIAHGATALHSPPAEGPPTAACDMISYQVPMTPPPEPRSAALLRVEGYDILDRLGSGGMGVVFKARHRQLNRVVALKMLGRDALADPESHRRFQTEAEAVARLQHPNIIQVFDVGTFSNQPGDPRPSPYLSLEYVDGGSLFKQTLTPQDPTYAARTIEKVARAVHAAHQVGVIHRDLKPANVLLTGEGEPKIADFGLAKQIDHRKDERGGFLTQDGTAVGTPEYMAPEQVDGLPATPAFDIYSLGVILYELLTARQPFKGLTLTETMLLVKYQEPVPPSRLRPTLPKDLETICLKCMAKSPAGRYATAGELADDLARWLGGRPIHARPVGRVERLGRWAKRNPSLATLSALALLLAVAGVSGVTWQWRDAVRNYELAERRAKEVEDRRLGELWEMYRASVTVAAADLRVNTLNSTRSTLLRAPEEHRNWEWWYYRHQLDTATAVVPVGGPPVENVEVTTGGRALIRQGTVHSVWDLAARRPLGDFLRGGGALSPDGRWVGTHKNGRMSLRPAEGDGAEVVLTDPCGPVVLSSVSGDGERAVTVSDHAVRVWDVRTGRLVGPGRKFEGGIGGFALSHTGRLVAQHEQRSGAVVVWEADTGRTRLVIPKIRNLWAVEFSPDARRLLVNQAFPENTVRVWDTATGAEIRPLAGHTNNVLATAFSPDARVVATASRDKTVRLWDAADGRLRATLRGHSGAVNSAAFSPDGKRLVTAADDRTVRTWDVETGAAVATFRGHENDAMDAAFVDGGTTVASVSRDGTIRYWDARSGADTGVWAGHTGFVYGVAYHPDGRHAVSAGWDGTARVWDAAGQEVRRFDHPPGSKVCAVAVHPNGKWVATLCWGENAYLWDFATGKRLHAWEVNGGYWKTGRLAFHPTGDLLAVVGGRDTVRLFDPTSGKVAGEMTLDVDAIRDVAFSPDGKWLAAAGDSDKAVHVWEVATRKKVHELRRHTDAAYALAFSPDGLTLASGSLDGDVHLWDVTSGERVGSLPHGVKVYGLAFTPDGSRLACGCADNTVRLWDVARREQVAELHGHIDYVHHLAFSPGGHRLLTASGDQTLRLWDASPVAEPPEAK